MNVLGFEIKVTTVVLALFLLVWYLLERYAAFLGNFTPTFIAFGVLLTVLWVIEH